MPTSARPTLPRTPCCPHAAGHLPHFLSPCHCETSDRCHWLWQSAPPSPRPPCLKGAVTAKPCLGDSSPHELTANAQPFSPQVSLHQPSVGPPPFRQGRLFCVGATLAVARPTALLVTLRRGRCLHRPARPYAAPPTGHTGPALQGFSLSGPGGQGPPPLQTAP